MCTKLDLEKENHSGKKNYHTMIALYFLDLAKVWRELRKVCKDGAAFYGAVLAGEFTENSLNQMKSEGFKILYFSIHGIEEAFASQGVDEHWDESTSEEVPQNRVEQLETLTETQLRCIGDYLIKYDAEQWEIFSISIHNALERTLESISILSLFGDSKIFYNIQDSFAYISKEEKETTFTKDLFCRYEIVVRYSNGGKIDMQFKSADLKKN